LRLAILFGAIALEVETLSRNTRVERRTINNSHHATRKR
jgi:hypothetical protein